MAETIAINELEHMNGRGIDEAMEKTLKSETDKSNKESNDSDDSVQEGTIGQTLDNMEQILDSEKDESGEESSDSDQSIPEETIDSEDNDADKIENPKDRKKMVNCVHCNKQFESRQSLKLHEEWHELMKEHSKITSKMEIESKPFQCKQCPKGFFSVNILSIHEAKHKRTNFAQDTPNSIVDSFFSSSIFEKKNDTESQMAKQFSITIDENGDKNYNCDECPYIGTTAKDVWSHKLSHSEVRLYPCDMCHKAFKTKDKFKIHVDTVHSEERPFSCEECSKCFKTVVVLNAHLKTHMEERPFKCQICEKGFTQKAHLKRHVVVHTGEKPYSCDICNDSFSQSSGLLRHKTIHTGEKNYVCKVCNEAFSQSAHLIRHSRIHTGEKPFACTFPGCSLSFAQSSGQKRHTETHGNHEIKQKLKKKVNQGIKQEDYDFDIKVEQENYISDENESNMDENENSEMFNCDGCKNNFDSITFETHIEKCIELTRLVESSNDTNGVIEEAKIKREEYDYKIKIEQDYCSDEHNMEEDEDSNGNEGNDNYVKCDGCQNIFDKDTFENTHLETCSKFENDYINQVLKVFPKDASEKTEKKPKLFTCQLCDHKVSWKESLARHMVTAHGTKKFSCDQCDYVANRKDNLKTHKKTHTRGNTMGIQYECTQCDYKASCKNNFLKHLEKIHEKETKDSSESNPDLFVCKICEHKLSNKGSLTRHMLSAHGSSKFPCDQCAYVGNRLDNLKEHKKSHTGIHLGIRYDCPQCNFKASHKTNLKKHIERFH